MFNKRERSRLRQALKLAIDSEEAIIDAYTLTKYPSIRYVAPENRATVERSKRTIAEFLKLLDKLTDP